VFSETPYSAVSITDVARAAGVTRGLVHHYFGGKPQLFAAVVESLADFAPSPTPGRAELPLEDLVSDGVDAWLDFVANFRELALAVGAAGRYPEDPALQAVVQSAREAIVRRIAPNLTAGEAAPPELGFLIRSYLGLADAAAREWLYHNRVGRDEVHTLLSRALLELIRSVLPSLTRTRPASGDSQRQSLQR
jgi:AcrR family transcriptional regulator